MSQLILTYLDGAQACYTGDQADKIYSTIKKACTHSTRWAFIQSETTEEYISMKNLCNVYYQKADLNG